MRLDLGEEFYKNHLDMEGKNCYDQIYQHLLSGQPNQNCEIRFLKESDCQKQISIVQNSLHAVRYDHPELFFMSLEGKLISIGKEATLEMNTLYSNNEINQMNRSLAQLVVKVSRNLKTKSQWGIEKSIYEFLCTSYQYSESNGLHNHSVVGFLRYGEGVCEAFTDMMIIMLRYNGIPAIRVLGKGKHREHCWIIAWIDGKPYHLDPTGDIKSREIPGIVFRYFNLSSQEILKNQHTIDKKYGYPCCNSDEANYYVHENRYCLDLNQLKETLKKDIKKGCKKIWVRTRVSMPQIQKLMHTLIGFGNVKYYSSSDIVLIQIS